MSRLGPEKVGLFLRQQGDELTRIWRMARASARSDVFPGLIDGLVGRFFELSGLLLSEGRPPEEVYSGLSGVLRWPAGKSSDELAQEWALLHDVVTAACEAVNASPSANEWLLRALSACESGTQALGTGGPRPAGVVTLHYFSPLALPHERLGKDENPP
ncbi:MAG TPA: hypothetical protein VLV17_00830 [Anaeromyxobacteraceae bacterium]|nr:hypothetical protein [Anaeromyxobacteraceae bacterium]